MYTISTPKRDAARKAARAQSDARKPYLAALYVIGAIVLILAASYGDTLTGINPTF